MYFDCIQMSGPKVVGPVPRFVQYAKTNAVQ